MRSRQVGACWTMQAFLGPVNDFGFKPVYSWEPLKEFKQRSRFKNVVVSTLVAMWRRDWRPVTRVQLRDVGLAEGATVNMEKMGWR